MTVSDDELMAYADGELDPERAENVRVLIAERADVAHRVAEQQALRDQLQRSFDTVLDTPVPQRLLNSLSRGRVIDLSSVIRQLPRRIVWSTGLGLAAGILVGVLLFPVLPMTSIQQAGIVASGGDVTAGVALESVLSHQLMSEQHATDSIRVGMSFLSKSGEYCRTFTSDRSGKVIAGIACHHNLDWRIEALQVVNGSHATSGSYQQAASALPPSMVEAINELMAGEALDARSEAEALERSWRVR